MDYSSHCEELAREGERVVALAGQADAAAPVPSCPEWTVQDLLAHVGMVHRWAEHLVRVRARERISVRDMDLSRGPVDGAWLAQGVAQLVATLRRSDPAEEMWAWGADQHVAFWARRQLHETLVHRLDLEGAMGRRGDVDPDVGADAIDEFFVNLASAARFSPDVKNLVGTGETLTFATDEGRQWTIRLDAGGFSVFDGADGAGAAGGVTERDAARTATLTGPTQELLRVVTRRRALEGSTCAVTGSRQLLEHWLANSALQ